ncbi:RimK-like ATP-grasp domain-containing protein [Streptomyces sp. TLI_235]|nr:hypothetical protein [Streptomyces sp. TLI_235]PBC76734.1 RimK-like ATP-grasp domain-containing protein [Streptomyces sp. TLI_235]
MITAVGLGADPTLSHFAETAGGLGARVTLVDLGDQAEGRWRLGLPPDRSSWVSAQGVEFALDPDAAVYCRLIDLGAQLPGRAVEWHTVTEAWSAWLELAPGRVVNRPGHPGDNSCKPLHEELLARQGFAVPPSVTTSSARLLRDFAGQGPCVAKPLSGQRADCRVIGPADLDRYDERSGPVHLQRWVAGTDVRVHVVGDRAIAQAVSSESVDYRTDRRATYRRIDLDTELERALVAGTAAAGLAFAGWDLRLGDDTAWVFEVNPMPGYSHYDVRVDGEITRALVAFLTEGDNR